MLFLNASHVNDCLSMREAVDGMKQALAALSSSQVNLPLRTHIDVDLHSGTTLIMPAMVGRDEECSLAVKIVSVFQDNPQKHLARIQALVVALDPQTGRPIAVLEGSSLTGIRTAAASGAATDLLARPDAASLAILGAGVQAQTHLQAMLCVRDIEQIRVFSRSRESAQRFVNHVRSSGRYGGAIDVASSGNEAVESADIVCTVTTSHEPVFDDDSVAEGTHINAVGSYQPHVREIPAETVCRSRVLVDHLESALAEAGDLIQPINAGLIGRDHVVGEIGQVALGELTGRNREDEITLFKSVGNAAEDAVAAQIVVRNARERGVGQSIEL